MKPRKQRPSNAQIYPPARITLLCDCDVSIWRFYFWVSLTPGWIPPPPPALLDACLAVLLPVPREEGKQRSRSTKRRRGGGVTRRKINIYVHLDSLISPRSTKRDGRLREKKGKLYLDSLVSPNLTKKGGGEEKKRKKNAYRPPEEFSKPDVSRSPERLTSKA